METVKHAMENIPSELSKQFRNEQVAERMQALRFAAKAAALEEDKAPQVLSRKRISLPGSVRPSRKMTKAEKKAVNKSLHRQRVVLAD